MYFYPSDEGHQTSWVTKGLSTPTVGQKVPGPLHLLKPDSVNSYSQIFFKFKAQEYQDVHTSGKLGKIP